MVLNGAIYNQSIQIVTNNIQLVPIVMQVVALINQSSRIRWILTYLVPIRPFYSIQFCNIWRLQAPFGTLQHHQVPFRIFQYYSVPLETIWVPFGTIQAIFGNIGHLFVPLGTLRRSLPKPKYFGRNQEPTKKKVSVLVPGLTILEITGYWLGTWF